MTLFDSHGHIDDAKYNADRYEVLQRAFEAGVSHIINPSYDLASAQRAVDLAAKYEIVYAGAGVHPGTVGEKGFIFDIDFLREIANFTKTVAIGEVGLDFEEPRVAGIAKSEIFTKQKEMFIAQIELARELSMPLIIHCRKAHSEVIGILSGYSDVKAVIHCFSGSWGDAQKYLAMGHFLSFTGVITYATDYDRVIKNAPLDRIMIETDCPYLSPAPYRGKRNEPSFVQYVAQRIAEIKNEQIETIANYTTQNAKQFFGITI